KDGLVIGCGDNAIEITKDGITLKGNVLNLAASKSVKMSGKGPSLTLSDEAELTSKVVRMISSKGSLVLNDDVQLDGSNVKINCKGIDPNAKNDDGTKPKTQHLSIKLNDADLKAYANKEYILSAGGARFEGTTDGDGKVELDIPEKADVAQIVLFA